MNEGEQFIGVVRSGKFELLSPSRSSSIDGLTTIHVYEARPPESAELDLTEYEGKVIMLSGHDQGWIYSAQVIDQAGPILSAVVLRLFGPVAHKVTLDKA